MSTIKGLPDGYLPIECGLTAHPDVRRDVFLAALIDFKTAFPSVRVVARPGRSEALVQFADEDLVEWLSRYDAPDLGGGLIVGMPMAAYRETLSCPAEIDHTHRKQGFKPQFARIRVRFEPLGPGSGFVFARATPPGAVPDAYVPDVRNGLLEASKDGLLAGHPVTDFKATLVDGAFHDLDSSGPAFEMAARVAFRKLKGASDPRLLEPWVRVDIRTRATQAAAVRTVLMDVKTETHLDTAQGDMFHSEFGVTLVNWLGKSAAVSDATHGSAEIRTVFDGLRPVPRHPPSGDDTYLSDLGMRQYLA